MSEQPNLNPTPPWRKPAAAEPSMPEPVPMPETTGPSTGLEGFFNRPGSAWGPIGVGFAGGFGAAALFLIIVSVITRLQSRDDVTFWTAIASAGVVGLVAWSWFLSRVRVYRSQSGDPDFDGWKSKRTRSGRNGDEDPDGEAEFEAIDEDDEPWL